MSWDRLLPSDITGASVEGDGRVLEFTVFGEPTPKGSLRPVPGRGRLTGKTMLIPDNQTELLRWAGRVIDAARSARVAAGMDRPMEAAMVELEFNFARPAGHYGSGKNAGQLLRSAPAEKVTKPDLDKLVRAVYDSLTQAYVVLDDNAIVESHERKQFGEPCLCVKVTELALRTRQEALL